MQVNDAGRVRGLLSCGHWTEWRHLYSSTWDFPMELQSCATCGDRYLDVELQARLLDGANPIPTEPTKES